MQVFFKTIASIRNRGFSYLNFNNRHRFEQSFLNSSALASSSVHHYAGVKFANKLKLLALIPFLAIQYPVFALSADSTSGNNITVSTGQHGDLYGGKNYNGDASSNNTVTFTGDANARFVIGGSGTYVLGHGSDSGNGIFNNSVTISGGTITLDVIGGLGEYTTISGNSVNITGGSIGRSVIGGGTTWDVLINYEDPTVSHNIENNSVTMSGGSVAKDISGGESETYDNVTILNNNVTITGGSVGGNVYGGKGGSYNIGYTPNDDAKLIDGVIKVQGNEVTIGGNAIIGGNVYGGYAYNSYILSSAFVTNNTVTLTGSNTSIKGAVYGGYLELEDNNYPQYTPADYTVDLFSGNTLNLNQYRGSLSGIYNFENYNWILPTDVVNGETLIHITGSDAVDLTNTKQSVAMVNDGNQLKIGDKITLIDQVKNTPNYSNLKVSQGQFLVYNMSLKQENIDDLVLTVIAGDDDKSASINPRSKSFSEGRAAALAFVSQGSDLIADQGIQAARSASKIAGGMTVVPFYVMNGSSNTYKTGSHVDVDGVNIAAGVAAGFDTTANHHVTLGAFYEYGRGTYNSYNSFSDYASVHGNGETHYSGGGILGRIDFAQTGLGRVSNLAADQADGLYLEASLRAGKLSYGFDSNDLTDADGYRGAYNSKASYYGAHGGIGYVFNFDERQSLDVYGRYLWTKVDGDAVGIGAVDQLQFKSSQSSRIRIGGRYHYAYSDQIKPYLGVAYEHEFKGGIAATAYNMDLAKPTLKGGTAIFEAGVSFKPIKTNMALSLDVNAQAYTGQRQGGGGGIKLKYQF